MKYNKHPRLFLLLLTVLNFCVSYGHEFEIKFRHLTVKDRLSQGWVRNICQDKYGFLWFGTGDGLNKFDGYEFKIYKNSPGNKSTINNNNIKKILEDTKGNLWIGTQEGLNLYNRELDIIQPVISNMQLAIEDIAVNDDGNVLLATPAGLFLLDSKSFVLKQLLTGYINVILKDRKKNIWLGTFDGLLLIKNNDFSSNKRFRFDPQGSIDNNVRSIYQDKSDRIWVGTNNSGMILMEYKDAPDKPLFKNFNHKANHNESINQGAILAITENENGNLWIGIENGGLDIIDLKSFNPDNCIFKHYLYNSNDESSISNNSIHSIFKDNQNTMWIGTYGGGINYYNKLTQKFKTIRQIPNDPNGLTDNHINVLYSEGDYLWIGTEEGLNILNKKNNTFQHYKHNNQNISSLGANAVWAIFRDSRKNMWIGTWVGGFDLMNEKRGSFTHFRNESNNEKSIGGNNIFRIIEDKDGAIWLASMNGGVNRFDYKTKTFKRYQYDSNANSLSNNWVGNLMEYGNDEIWISTVRAIDVYNKKSGRFTSFRHDEENKKSISYNGGTVLLTDSRKNIWIGTKGGLNLFHRNDSTFTYYREENGLPSNTINGIVEDNQGNLWISTNKGISKFIQGSMLPEKPLFKNYDASDGLQGNEFICLSYCKDEKGNIYFGGTNGFNVFNPDSLIENSVKPKVTITNFLIFNKPVEIKAQGSPLTKNICLTDEITLSHDQSVLTLEYAALNYVATEKNQYAFILEGFEKEWNYVGTKRTATYTNLDPGTYIFRVKASNNDGIWSDVGASLKILVLPPWWLSIWAKIIYLMLIITSLYIFRKYTVISTNFKKQLWLEHIEKEKSEELNKLKIQFFTNISHELRTPLSLIISPLENLLNSTNLKAEIKNQLLLVHRNADRLVKLVNDLMDFTKIEDRKLQISTRPDDVVTFTKELYNQFIDIAARQQIEYIFSCEHKEIVLWFDGDKLEKIILNLLSNAFKFTPFKGRIIISLERVMIDKQTKQFKLTNQPSEYLKISVIDNGPGIPNEYLDKIFERFYQVPENKEYNQSGTGIGLALAKSLTELHHGFIEVRSEPCKETCFSVCLPLNMERFQPIELTNGGSNRIKKNRKSKTDLEPIAKKKIASKSDGPLLLIAEDNYELREYIVSRLKESYNIIEAENGQIAYEKIMETFPDLIISDILMPAVTGIELCRRVKENISTSHIPVVLLTAKATIDDKIEGIETGADAYITKPFNLGYLEVTIRKLVETRKKLFQRFSQDIYIIPKEMSGNTLDQDFLEKSITYIHQNVTNPELSVENLAFHLLMSRSQTYRKIKALTGQSATEFIRTVRLKMAITLFEEGKLNISEIAYKTGFTSPAYFTKCFRIQFGKSPTEYFADSGNRNTQK